MDPAELLRAARAHAELTQRALATRARVPQPTIAAIERGRQDPRFGTLDRLLKACGYELDLLKIAGVGIDRTQFRSTLNLSPAGRLKRAAAGARVLRELRKARPVRGA